LISKKTDEIDYTYEASNYEASKPVEGADPASHPAPCLARGVFWAVDDL
jgi:hypothetical protein